MKFYPFKKRKHNRHIICALAAALMGGSLGLASPATADTLQEALVAAYQNHPQLMAERARVRESDETYAQAQSQGRFTASASGSISLTGGRGEFLDTSSGSVLQVNDVFLPRSFAITGQLPLYQGGRIRSLKGQARYAILSARENLRDAEQSVLLATATAYAAVLRDEEIARIRRSNVKVLARQSEAATERFNVGAGTRTDVAQALSRIAASEAGLASAEAALAASRAAFFRATGFMPNQLEPVVRATLPTSLEATAQMAVTYNPQLEAARYAIDAAKFGIDVARSNNRPSVSLQPFAQFQREVSSSVLAQDSIGLTANLTIPLLTGGLNSSQMRSAEAARTRAHFEMRNLENGLREQVSVLWAQLDAGRRSLTATQAQLDATKVAFEGVEIEQQVGIRTALDVLDAEQEVLEARLAVTQAQSSLDILTFQLLALTGAFDANSLLLPVNYYAAEDNFDLVTGYNIGDDFGRVIDEVTHIAGR